MRLGLRRKAAAKASEAPRRKHSSPSKPSLDGRHCTQARPRSPSESIHSPPSKRPSFCLARKLDPVPQDGITASRQFARSGTVLPQHQQCIFSGGLEDSLELQDQFSMDEI